MAENNGNETAEDHAWIRAAVGHLDALLREFSAVILLLLGLLLLYVFVSIKFWSVVGPISGIVVGGLLGVIGIALNRFYEFPTTSALSNSNPLDFRVSISLACSYAAAIVILFRFYTHQRPVLLYVLFGGYAGLIAYQIARGTSAHNIVPQLLSLSFFTYWSSQFLFPAGMYGPDTARGYLPTIEDIFNTGTIPAGEAIYAGHLGYAAEFSIVSGLPAQTGYFLLATLLLVGTVLVISTLDRVFPVITQRTALYAALVFSTSSWMLGRGFHPNKLNFFYALILLLGSTAILLYRFVDLSLKSRRYVVLGSLIMPAIIFGHQFSAGAAMIFLLVISVFGAVSHRIAREKYGVDLSAGPVLVFVAIYLLGVLGNPIHQGPLLGRFADLIMSVAESVQTASVTGFGGPGRYSALPLNVLIASTAAQTVLFTLGVLGAVWLFKQRKWEFDFVIVWMGAISCLLVVSLLTNSVDTAPQRFYGLLILFGFNVCAGGLFYLIDQRGVWKADRVSINGGRAIVVVLVILLATTSLASPVADKATSPVADDLPHFRQFDTAQRIQGDQWSDQYGSDISQLTRPNTDIPIERVDQNRARANLDSLNRGTIVTYSHLAERTGAVSSQGLSLGGRTFLFLEPPTEPTDSLVYTNNETIAYVTT